MSPGTEPSACRPTGVPSRAPSPCSGRSFIRDGSRDDLHFIAHAHWEDAEFELPDIGKREWFRLVDTALPSPQDIAEEGQEFPLRSQDSYPVKARSVVIFVAK